MAKTREIVIDDRNKIVIDTFKSEHGTFVNVRKFYLDKEGEWKPAKQGITIKEDFCEDFLKKFKFAFQKREDEARDLDLDAGKKSKPKDKKKAKPEKEAGKKSKDKDKKKRSSKDDDDDDIPF